VHEALHALFFSELLFPYYLDENGEQRKGVVKEDTNGNKMVVTPSVARAARNHFGCSDLEGAPLENEGAPLLQFSSLILPRYTCENLCCGGAGLTRVRFLQVVLARRATTGKAECSKGS
jgi:hypothetical protein